MRDVIAAFSGLEVVVVGDVLLDAYLEGEASGLAREAPVPIVRLTGRVDRAGGAANAAVALAALGARVTLVSVTGDDDEGVRLRAVLEAAGVRTERLLVRPDRTTPAKSRVVAGGQLLVRVDSGSSDPVDERTETALAALVSSLAPTADAVLVSDYGHGVLSEGMRVRLEALRPSLGGVVVVDAKSPARWAGVRPTAVKPNWGELQRVLGPVAADAVGRVELLAASADRVLEVTGAQVAAVTLDRDGSLVLERGRPPYRTYATPAPDAKATGAGDTYVAALTLALAAGASTTTAAELASAAAAVVVGKEGTATCTAAELVAAVAGEDKRVEPAALAEIVASVRAAGRRIVFTNGCFDLLHRGHVTYLSQAKARGDLLVVGVNDDASVERLKGRSPVNGLDDRVGVLAALSCVDLVVAFSGDTADELIRLVRPDVYVKGGDHSLESLPEAPLVEALGGRVELVDHIEDRSTSLLLSRIRAGT